jgi:uncharacterized protein YuzE
MQLTYDDLTDTLYVYYSQEPVARSVELSDRVVVDYDGEDRVRGVEILEAVRGPRLALDDLPRRDDFTRLIEQARRIPLPV